VGAPTLVVGDPTGGPTGAPSVGKPDNFDPAGRFDVLRIPGDSVQREFESVDSSIAAPAMS